MICDIKIYYSLLPIRKDVRPMYKSLLVTLNEFGCTMVYERKFFKVHFIDAALHLTF